MSTFLDIKFGHEHFLYKKWPMNNIYLPILKRQNSCKKKLQLQNTKYVVSKVRVQEHKRTEHKQIRNNIVLLI